MGRFYKDNPKWRKLKETGLPESFIVTKKLVSDGVELAPGTLFPGASTERRMQMLYEHHYIGVPTVADEVEVKPKAKSKKSSKVK
jgi:hypothetical protein